MWHGERNEMTLVLHSDMFHSFKGFVTHELISILIKLYNIIKHFNLLQFMTAICNEHN